MAAALVTVLGGCATFRSYNSEIDPTLSLTATGQVDTAIATLQKNNKGADKDLLFYFEMGEFQRLALRYGESLTAWQGAEWRVQAWEDAARADPARVAGTALSYIVNDKLRPYEGQDYEKVMLTTRMAMDDLAQGQWQNARVAIKRTHEREAVIAAVRSHEQEQIEEEARKRGAHAGFKDLNGYPVQTIDSPEVNSLRNSYQSAFSHYLAGFVYEALNEPSLAAAGYRNAIELHPNVPMLEQALAGLDQRVAAPDDGKTDVLFEIESGLVPARVSQQFSLPIPINERWVLVSASFPVLRSRGEPFVPSQLRVEGFDPLVPVQITSVDAMARRALRDEMPGLILRTVIRSITKATAQYQVERAASKERKKGNSRAGTWLDLSAFALAIGSAATETADERSWRNLPAAIYIARTRLPRGPQRIQMETPAGTQSVQIDVEGRYALVSLRVVGGSLFAMLPQAPLRSTADAINVAPAASAGASWPRPASAGPAMAQSSVGTRFTRKE